MSDDPANHLASRTTRRLTGVTAMVCTINFIIHLFPVSLMGFFDWYPKQLRQDSVEEGFWQLLAWMEFGLINALVLFIVFVLLAFILIREFWNFVRCGRGAMTLDACTFLILISSPAMAAYFMFGIIPAGPDALEGTRAAGLGLSFLMFLVAFLTGVGGVAVVAYAAEPKTMQAAFALRSYRAPKAK